jgi:hypothetical protein
VALSRRYRDEDPGVILLADIRRVFGERDIDRISSASLIEALIALDDGFWSEWRGPKEDRSPKKLSQPELAALLRNFGIRSRTVWALRRSADTRSARGYMKSQFEAAWQRYCQPDDTAAHPGKIKQLRG